MSIENLTGENIKKNSASCNLEKKSSENKCVRTHETVSNFCSLIDSIKINFLKLETTFQSEIGRNQFNYNFKKKTNF